MLETDERVHLVCVCNSMWDCLRVCTGLGVGKMVMGGAVFCCPWRRHSHSASREGEGRDA